MTVLKGRCYCGEVKLAASKSPETVAVCHCADCKRITGSPLPVFAAFAPDDISFAPSLGAPVSHTAGVNRWFCHSCGSPLAAQFDYLPDQVYVPLGLLESANDIVPDLHCHAAAQAKWLQQLERLPRHYASGREALQSKG